MEVTMIVLGIVSQGEPQVVQDGEGGREGGVVQGEAHQAVSRAEGGTDLQANLYE